LRIDAAKLLGDWGTVVGKVGAVPTQAEYKREGSHGVTSLITRFQGWSQVPAAFVQFVKAGALTGDWTEVLDKIRNGPIPMQAGAGTWIARRREEARAAMREGTENSRTTRTADACAPAALPEFLAGRWPEVRRADPIAMQGQMLPPPLVGKKCVTETMLAVFVAELAPGALPWITAANFPRRVLTDRPLLGEPMRVPGMAHAPVNEMGVMLLFAMVAVQLGFVVESVRAAFPDCLAKIEVEPGRWQYLRIEFEYESRAFQEHGHDPQQCDMIVCWKHNWKGCPPHLQVLELSRIVGLGR
jgi:hypothetical protein